MSKTGVIGFIAASLILAGCYHTGQTGTQATPAQTGVTTEGGEVQVSDGANVSYTDSGFTPGRITVEAGTTVTFINESSGRMWVASTVHPAHQDLPGFDQLKAIGNGASYSYTFQVAGEWGYHNHVAPGDTGVVVVE